MTAVFLNGRFVEPDQARISAFDAGFQHAVGLFETLSAHLDDAGRPRVFALEDHLQRLIRSAADLGLSDSLRPAPLAEAVLRTVETAALPRARVRLTITGGDLSLLGRTAPAGDGKPAPPGPPRPVDPTLLIVAQPATDYPADLFERGAAVVIADLRLNPLDPMAGHKTLNYWARLRALQAAAAARAGEALVFQISSHLAGGCVSNIVLIREGRLLTPIARGEEQEVAEEGDRAAAAAGRAIATGAVMPSPVLPGITRKWLMGWARDEGLAVDRRMLTIDDVLSADEVLLTNSSWGILPVVKIEKEAIGDGVPGPLTQRARAAWLEAQE
jgi:branched-subunit amino acid aminotransferase/4-amino-4-deoxychorismate lyase